MKKAIIRVAALIAVLVVTGGAYAADSGTAGTDGWKTEVAPYAWLAGISGDFTAKGLSANVNESFNDLSKYLDFGGMVHVESKKDKFSILFDETYIKLSDSRTFTKLDITLNIMEFGGVYQVLGVKSGQGLALDVLGGGRYWYMKGEVGLFGVVDQAGRQGWIDPFVGARLRWGFTKNLMLVVRGDVGGFDINRCSTSSWNASGILLYSFTDSFSVGAGYRAMYDHYENGNGFSKFEFNATLKGPIVGLNFSF